MSSSARPISNGPLYDPLPAHSLMQAEKYKRLVEAVNQGQADLVEHLIKSNANVNDVNGEGHDLLRDAIWLKYPKIVSLLIENRADLNIKDKYDRGTPLHAAVYLGNIKLLRLLIAGNADLNSVNLLGETPFYGAVEKEAVELAKLLVENKADPNIPNKEFKTPLHVVSSLENVELAKFLIENKAEVNALDRVGRTPLYGALWKGKIKIVAFLVENGAKVNTLDNEGKTPLYLASCYREAEVAKYLIENGADVNIPDKEGISPLHKLAKYGDTEFARFLIQKGAKVNVADRNHRTPLYWAFRQSFSPMIELLIQSEAPFFIHESLDLTAINQLIKKLAYYRNAKIRTKIAILIFENITCEAGKRALECIEMAIEQSEVRDLNRRLARNDYGNLANLLKEAQAIEKSFKKLKTSKEGESQSKKALEEKKRQIEQLQMEGNSVRLLLKENKVQEAKKKLRPPLEKKSNDFIICCYLVGLMMSNENTPEDLKLIIDFFIKISFKGQYESVALVLYNLLKNNELNNAEKIAVLKKIITEIAEKELSKQDFFKALSRINTLIKLQETDKLKEFIHPDSHIEHLKGALDTCLQSKFNLNIEDIAYKYEATFGNSKQFRYPDLIFIYLASLSTLHKGIEKEKAIELFFTYVEDVLEGKFIERRYNIEDSSHLEKIFQGEFGSQLLEKWKQNETLPVEELVKSKEGGDSTIDYQKTFHEKIITDSHLGKEWEEIYPHLATGLDNEKNTTDSLNALDSELTDLKTQIQQITSSVEREALDEIIKTLEAQKLLLELCQNKDLKREVQIQTLKKASGLFLGTEFQNDLNALLAGLSSVQAKHQNTSKYTICATDHPCDILLMGYEISGSCQRLNGNSSHNIGLLGPLLDGKYLIIAVKNNKEQMVARCLLKILLDEKTGAPVLFQERLYVNNEPNNAAYHSELLNAMCLRKAQAMSLPLLRVAAYGSSRLYPNPIASIGGRSQFEYVDALRGVVNQSSYVIPECSIVWAPTKVSI